MPALGPDLPIRLAAFAWLAEQVGLHGDVLPWAVLAKGFQYQGERVPLVSQQGIFKPRVLKDVPLSIRTAVDHPYTDAFEANGLLRYSYRGTDPWHRENVGLRQAMQDRVPLVYFHGVAEGKYLAAWPVFIVGDDPAALRFTVALDDASHVSGGIPITLAERVAGPMLPVPDEGAAARREYITATFQRRLHQRAFRERVLAAYGSQCALCRLRHEELLDAGHIIPDCEPDGDPVVPNALAFCKLHHAAYDRHFLTVTPDCVIEVRPSILEEEDGPMLLHGLKEMHGKGIRVPRDRRLHPDRDRLEWRYKRFREAG